MQAGGRDLGVALFGATGFAGRLIARYLARHAPPGLRWAIAGRHRGRLQELAESLAHLPSPPADVLEATVEDPSSLATMARRSTAVLTTVGPYVHRGLPVVEACVGEATDYLDITGEPAFVHAVQDRFGEAARARGIRIVNCCGFDSIPPDLGAWVTAGELPEDAPMTIACHVSGVGRPSGGTWHSALGAMADLREMLRGGPPAAATPGRTVSRLPARIYWEPATNGWACPLPTIDTEIVLRSAASLPRYGPDFRYGHYVRLRSLPQVLAGIVGVGAVVGLAQLPPTRALLLRLLEPGAGPDPERRARHWFSCVFLGEGGGRRVRVEVSGGDAGYDETAKMASEAALSLVVDRARLPERSGVLTPAEAMAEVLVDRLALAGLPFRVVSRERV